MSKSNFRVDTFRFHLEKENTIVMMGWFLDDKSENEEIEVLFDGQRLEVEMSKKSNFEVRQKYLVKGIDIWNEYLFYVKLPTEWRSGKRIEVVSSIMGTKTSVYRQSIQEVLALEKAVNYNIETISKDEDTVSVYGWAADENLSFEVLDGENVVESKVQRSKRADIGREFIDLCDEKMEYGFILSAKQSGDSTLKLRIYNEKRESEVVLDKRVAQFVNDKPGFWGLVEKTFRYLRKSGLKVTIEKIQRYMAKRHKQDVDYPLFLEKNKLTSADIQKQKDTKFEKDIVFSIVVPLYKTPEKFLREMIESVIQQTYANWELCLADGSGEDSSVWNIIEQYAKKEKRIKIKKIENNLGIAENTNVAIAMATGRFVVLLDHDDLLTADALYECAKAVEADESIEVMYSDEDKVDMNGKVFYEPNFKSDFNIDLLCSVNYICHLFVFDKRLFDENGGFRKEYDGAQDHDLILRYTEKAKKIHHIPKVLYHWRCHRASTSSNPASKLYAFENGAKAVEDHYKRIGVPARVERGEYYGLYHTIYEWEEKPLVSILVPNKDHVDDLKTCMDAIDNRSTYRNFEWIIIENNSTEEETFEYYEKIKKRDNVKVVYYKGGFNFSKINNTGAEVASGDYLLLLNNDTEMINDNAIEEMVNLCMRDDVGIVGARLFYHDDTIQHAGVVIGFGGIAGHTFIGKAKGEAGYGARIISTCDYSAVTAACLMTPKHIYEQVGGLTESFEVAFNDIDYCLKVRELDKLVVYNPYAEFHHYESKSRGFEDTPEKVQRFQGEIARFTERWERILREGDPYYNPNLALDRSDFGLKI